jgi:hypothetical protein
MKPPSISRLRGEAVTLWRLGQRDNRLHCFIVEPPSGFWLAIEKDGDLLFSQTYADLDCAIVRAEGLKLPLLLAGWTELADH